MIQVIEFLEYIISNHDVFMNSRRIKVIQTWFELRTLRELQIFLEFANFYKRFVRFYAKITRVLTKLFKESKQERQSESFIFEKVARQAFWRLIKAFTKALMLIHFDLRNLIRVKIDASGFVIAAILSQFVTLVIDVKQTQWHSIVFYLKKMIFAEIRYETHDQELLFIVAAFQQWRHYFENNHHSVTILTNHNNLRYFMKTTALNKRQSEWALALAEYDFEIKYRFKKINSIDGSSRRSDYKKKADDEICLFILQNKLKNIIVIVVNLISVMTRDFEKTLTERTKSVFDTFLFRKIDEENVEEFFDVEKDDLFYNVVTQQLRRSDARETCSSERQMKSLFKFLMIKLEKFQEKNSVIIKVRDQLKSQNQRDACAIREWSFQHNLLYYFHVIYISDETIMKAKMLRLHHDNSLTKHFEIKKTRSLLQRKFYWLRMLKDIKEYIQNCDICQCVKTLRHRLYDETTSLFISVRFWEEISMNFIIEFFSSRYENDIYDATLVVIDRYSKMTLYILAKSTWSAEDFADVLFNKMFLIFLEIKRVIFDRDSLFVNDYWFALCYRIRVKRKLSIVFHSQIDEQTKKQNQTLKYYLRCYCNYKQDN